MSPEVLAKSVQHAMEETAKDPSGQWKAGIMGWAVRFVVTECDDIHTYLSHQYHNAQGFHDWADPSAHYLAGGSSNKNED